MSLQLPLWTPDVRWSPPAELPSLRGAQRVAVDVETRDPTLTTLGPGVRRGGYVVGIAVGVAGGGRWYLPMRHEGGGNLDPDLVLRWARAELNDLDGELVGASLLYDLDYLAEVGVTFPRVRAFHDVQMAEPLLDEWRFEYNLDALARDYLGEGKDEALLREAAAAYGLHGSAVKSNLWRLPAGFVGPYAEADVDRPLRILERQLPRLAEEGLEAVYEVERKLIPILLAMRRRGVRIDVAAAERLRAELSVELAEHVAELKRLAGPRAELNEPTTFAAALEARGVPVPLTPKSGQPSVTKALLERYAADPLVARVLAGRKVDKLISTFLDSQILGHAVNGRVHPTFHQLKGDEGGTIGRFSCSNPNFQFLPARDEVYAPRIRGVVVPEEGEEWQRDDASQIEFRLLTHFAVGNGAEAARRAYNEDAATDFHKLTATMLGADPEDKVRRKRVKNTNFCKVYGGGVPKLAETFGCSLDEAQAFADEYDAKLPFVRATYEAAAKWANRRGYVVTVLNRRQRFPFWEPPGNYGAKKQPPLPLERARAEYGPRLQRAWTYTALNKKLQISCADLMKKAMVDAWEAGICDVLGPYLVTVHDELGTSVPPTPAGDEAGRELTRVMERAIELKVPVLVESQRGKSWGECK